MTDAQRELIRQFAAVGFDKNSVKAAIRDEDWTHLRHTGRVTVKLEPPRGEG